MSSRSEDINDMVDPQKGWPLPQYEKRDVSA